MAKAPWQGSTAVRQCLTGPKQDDTRPGSDSGLAKARRTTLAGQWPGWRRPHHGQLAEKHAGRDKRGKGGL